MLITFPRGANRLRLTLAGGLRHRIYDTIISCCKSNKLINSLNNVALAILSEEMLKANKNQRAFLINTVDNYTFKC